MDIQFDTAKDAANIAKHGISLACAADVDWSDTVTRVDARRDYAEQRFVAIAPLGERLYVVVYTVRHGARRVISMRKANPREIRDYVKHR